jgi:hypothetical protein
VKNGFSFARSGKSDVASVSASASCRSSSPGLQYGDRRAYLARQLDVLRFGARRVRIRPSALVAWLERGGKTTAA